ncbi:hypothetical protein Aspvir_004853 [Aspergillus viridinutans]|uniref:GPI anchored protein n=1 Tax=Aspergillus viridinutans TaxID=75553 RepID=A0A9P3F0X4_ASPVI|nr:uncharacterized protein Aspvir_004853 [Aspergillus viridinutans]GIK00824.1 hypothetical protein Aspvir_004853 [Aspergillus viridinutans]
MRPLQLLALSGLMLASNIALAAELDRDDVPNRCWNVCGPVVGIAQRCDNMHRDDDRAEMKCICDWNQAPTLVPLCEACIAQFRNDTRNDNGRGNDRDDDHDDHGDDRREIHDNDAYDILTSCSFSTTTYNTAAATSILSSATGTISATATNSAGSSNGSGGNTGNSQSSSTNTSGNAQTTNNAAAGSSVPKAASVAAVVGLIGLAWL